MAVPKKKVSPSRRGMRRGGNGTYKVKFPTVVEDKETGEYTLPHHITPNGNYKGKKVIEDNKKKEENTEDK